MAELTTIARPYAQAVFKRAQEAGALPAWSGQLGFLAQLCEDPALADVLDHGQVSSARAADLLIEIGGQHLDAEAANLVRVLAENHRLGLLPEIAAVYEKLRAEAERTVDAQVVSAQPMDEAQQQGIVTALERRLGCSVRLQCSTDSSLLGGAVIRAGDLVIDGSVQGKLAKLATTLNH